MADVMERLSAANPLPECSPLSIDEVWRRLEETSTADEPLAKGTTAGADRSRRRRSGWLGTGMRAVPILTSLAIAVAVVVFAIGVHARRAVSPAQTAGRVHVLAVQQLVSGRLPGRETFDIVGERYRFQGRTYFGLDVHINRAGAPAGAGGGVSFTPAQTPGDLAWSEIFGCPHPREVIVYGLVRVPAAEVDARIGNAVIPLSQDPWLPQIPRADGVLFYGVLRGLPSELIVSRANEKPGTLYKNFPIEARCVPGGAKLDSGQLTPGQGPFGHVG